MTSIEDDATDQKPTIPLALFTRGASRTSLMERACSLRMQTCACYLWYMYLICRSDLVLFETLTLRSVSGAVAVLARYSPIICGYGHK